MGPSAVITTARVDGASAIKRMVSIDALRGFDMFWIIGADEFFKALKKVSNTGPAAFLGRQFHHVSWEGFLFYDLIFPLFVFIIGISLVFSLDRILENEGKAAAYKRIFRRAALLFLLGVFYDEGVANWHEENVICGVLQRLALAYFFTGLLYCNFKRKGLVVAFLTLILAYWALLSFVPVPSTGKTSFAPEVNWTHYVDQHMPPYYREDPEGFLSTATAVASCLLGVFAAFLLKDTQTDDRRKVLILIAGGAAMTILGYAWGMQMPVIKRLWTSSYVLVAGGYSCMLLGVFYQVINVWRYRKWVTPFIWIGSNSLTIYMVTNMADFHRLAERFGGGDIAAALGRYGDLLVTVVAIGMSLLLVRYMYRKQIFIRV